MGRHLKEIAWIVAFVALCTAWGYEAVRANKAQRREAGPWICPIAGECGPPGTPQLGRW